MKDRERDGLEMLYEISGLLSSGQPELEIETILKLVLAKIAGRLGIIRGMITILNRNNGEIAIAEAWGLDSPQRSKGRYSMGEGITGRVIETGNPVVIRRIADEPLFLNRTGARKEAETRDISFICVPVSANAEVIGAIGIDIPYTQVNPDYEVQILTIAAVSIFQVVRLHQIRTEEMEAVKAENSRLRAQLRMEMQTRYKAASYVIGNSKIMLDLYLRIEQVSGTNATVLLLGESGVGKERIAQAVHYTSHRAGKPFIKVNCAAIPETLIESSLFGHEKGAFTGASAQRKGYFEQAGYGTIFLDEIAELPLPSQTKLLRVLQEREFERIGGSETVKVDIRIIAATNRDLQKLIDEGKFREDLYYRLSVFPLVIPPLRERKTDIMLLADHFVEKIAARNGKTIRSISPEAVRLMNSYSWPGNVRELENCIERAVILSTDGTIYSYHLPPSLQENRADRAEKGQTLKGVLESVEKGIIAGELRKTRGNLARAASNLGISERVMGLRAVKYGLK
ncbi:MAG: sigma 54-interacting transcriptional regulator [Treponema sp.]|jgi:Nif-specific regulatory protein|nr:sigma 54-interacting transcriptional regulator [Treponema sp.]